MFREDVALGRFADGREERNGCAQPAEVSEDLDCPVEKRTHTGIALTVAVALTVVLLIAYSALVWKMPQDFGDVAHVELELQRVKGIIVHLDEVLTMSCRLAASTGDERWERRYRKYEPLLDRAIKRAIELPSESEDTEAAVQTDVANIKLVGMENRAFLLVRRGQRKEAMAMLLGLEYSEQKQVYSRGMDQLAANIDNQIALGVGRYHQYLILVVSCTVLGSMTLVGTWLAVLRIIYRETAQRRQAEEALMRDISDRKQLEQQLAKLTEQERRRIGRALHDTTGQELTGLGFMAQSVLEQLATESHPEEKTVLKMEESIQRALAQVRRFAQGLVPVELDAGGLMAALQELATNTTEACNIPCTFGRRQQVSMEDNMMATQIYLIAKEALTNAVKHAQAKHVEIELSREDNRVTLLVRDDGVGIGEPSEEDGIGLRIMRHRAALIQATLKIEPVDKGGTQVMCVLAR